MMVPLLCQPVHQPNSISYTIPARENVKKIVIGMYIVKLDGEENARLGEKNSKLAENFLGNLKKKRRRKSKKPRKIIERRIKTELFSA